MPRYGTASLDALRTCDHRLVAVARAAILVVDFGVIQGHRSKAQQEANVAKGVSKTMKSKHLLVPSAALDFAPYIKGIGYLFGSKQSDIPKACEAYDISEHAAEALIREHYSYIAGVFIGAGAAIGVDLTWGGCWAGDGNLFKNKFDDLGHIELRVVDA